MEDLKKAQVAAKTYQGIANKENKMRTQLEKDLLSKDLETYLLRAIYQGGKSKGKAVKQYAKDKGLNRKDVTALAEKINL